MQNHTPATVFAPSSHTSLQKGNILEAGKMTQSIKDLSGEHEDLEPRGASAENLQTTGRPESLVQNGETWEDREMAG